LSLAVVTGVGCHLPAWSGTMPPVVPRADACGSGALTAEGASTIQRRPYLQRAEARGVIVAWAGPQAPPAHVAIATVDDPDRTPSAQVAGRPASAASPERAATLAARIEGLEPDVTYCYRLEGHRGPLTDWATLTLAPPPDPARVDRFVVVGDSGDGGAAQQALARRMASVPMDAILFLGDIAYGSGTRAQLQTRFFDVYHGLFQRVPVYSAIGNHDDASAHGQAFHDAFVLPGNERWYAFDLGDVHFVVLDTTQIGAAQAAWLEADLATASRRFTIVLAHHPPYTAARRGPSRSFQRTFVPILARHGVDLVLSGHEHHYERSQPLDGVVYVVSGGGGARLTPVGRAGHTRVARAVHHYLALEVRADALVLRAIDIDGNTFDELVLRERPGRGSRTASSPAAAPTGAIASSPARR